MPLESEPKWLKKELVLLLHQQSIARFGGSTGIRDAGLLESALSRAQQRYTYDETADIFDLVAIYCSAIIRNHPFVDGNKRSGLLAARSFLFVNGYIFEPDEIETVQMIEGHAASQVNEDLLVSWIRENSRPR